MFDSIFKLSTLWVIAFLFSLFRLSTQLFPTVRTQQLTLIEEDVVVLSSWHSLKYWTSNSSLHSSKVIENSNRFESNDSIGSKSTQITAIDFYRNESNCANVLIWCELSSQTIFSAIININDRNLYLTEMKPLFRMDLGSHVRLAVDSVKNTLYLVLSEFSRIDSFDIEKNESKSFLTNISLPIDIAIDSELQILFWIENWSCLCQTLINNASALTVDRTNCDSNARAIAVDPPNLCVYWSDSLGNIFRRNYFGKDIEMIFSAKKMRQNYALDVTNGAIYLSDSFKLASINKKTFSEKIVLIESPGIVDFKAIKLGSVCRSQSSDSRLDHYFNYNVSNETISNSLPINQSLIEMNSIDDNLIKKPNFRFNYMYLVLCLLVLITLIIIFSTIFGFKRFFRQKIVKRNQIKRISGEVRHRLKINDKNRLLRSDKSIGKTVCIEDLGSFGNTGYLDPFCTNCPLKQTCSSCDDREECIELGICLNSYKLLT